MRVAFDVKGTIDGYNSELVLKLFKGLQAKGHEVFVWSNLYSYAVDAIKDNHLKNTEPLQKMSRIDLEERELPQMDLAIEDDRSQTWLGANKFVFVDELTEETVNDLLR